MPAARRTITVPQPDLLSWRPPQPVARFEPERVRAVSTRAVVCRAISDALRGTGQPREAIARRMSEFLGEEVSKHMLDAYASPAREEHTISVPRFLALLHATRDRRLLELLAEPFGWTVIERRYLPLIELAAVREHEDEVRRRAEALRRQARAGGLL